MVVQAAEPKSFKTSETQGVGPWRLVRRFQTLEPALELLEQLRDRGETSSLMMSDGLAVISRDQT